MKKPKSTPASKAEVSKETVNKAVEMLNTPASETRAQVHKHFKKFFKKNDWQYWAVSGEIILEKWRAMAATDEEALRGLAAFLLMQSDNLRRDFPNNKFHHRMVAMKCASWPGEITLDKDLQKKQDLYAQDLLLGRFADLNFGKKQWSRNTPEIATALTLIKLMRRGGGFGMLPALDRNTASKWWKRAEPFFESYYGKDFENHKQFSHYWKNAVYKDQPNVRALIRRDIKKQIKQAFRSIARKPSAV